MIKTRIFLALTVLSSFFAMAFQDSKQTNRFLALTTYLEQNLSVDHNLDDILVNAEKQEFRFIIMMIEGLGKTYEKKHPYFEKLKNDFKVFEDKIGAYRFWLNIYNNGDLSPARRLIVETEKKSAYTNLKLEILKNWMGENGNLQKYKEGALSGDMPQVKDEKEVAIKRLRKRLKKINETQYDMSTFEHGDGLHELRRDLRWFGIQAKALGGTIMLDKTTCPVDAYAALVDNKELTSHKYAGLDNYIGETVPCNISACLYYGLLVTVEGLGRIKDKVELESNSKDTYTDITPVPYLMKANKVYGQLKATKVIDHIRSELKQCLL